MKFAPRTAAALALVLTAALSLAACGGGAEDAGEAGSEVTAGTATPAPEVTAATVPAATPAPGATPSEAPSATPSPTPTPSASATPAAIVAAKPAEFALCAACHSTEPGKNGIGPSLAGVFGAKAGHVSDFEYSEPMKSAGLTWNQSTLDRYLTDPKGVVPGTKMAYAGLKDAAKRQAMIAYLKSL